MSVATGQRSLGDPGQIFPLAPPLLSGCLLTNDAQISFRSISMTTTRGSMSRCSIRPPTGIARWAPPLPVVAVLTFTGLKEVTADGTARAKAMRA